jgi:hypothetical protein
MWLVSTMCVGERYNARKIWIGRNVTMGRWGGGGIPVTPVYEDMHANNDIRGKRKIKPVCDDQSPESNPKSSVVLCGHQSGL